ncbi:DUF4157 domain-containing protein [Chitinophaga agrisoli]|uniref:DUF4157 domain-containing protein n=1 Tax=Chitinophaga agrisoli TaxID=2607653 RepID=A0A5B2VGT5_9BACT|nr:DUF4157 domain-containing protein [Chitinophaga agrisoli]KAA2238783.1 DUF4157 domain-containing protein [Chitinophaga agrisoli]
MEHHTKPQPANDIRPAATNVQATPASFQRIMPQLTVGPVDDPYERQADAMADQVMRKAEPFAIQRKCAHCEEEEKAQRMPFIQRQANGDSAPASEAVTQGIHSSAGQGQALATDTRSFMESRLGADFSGVRVHTDSQAAELNQELQAKAFTVGKDIWFNSGNYQPGSTEGQHLLAHELTHVLQQSPAIQRKEDPKAVTEACLKNKDSILPGKTGLVGAIDRDLMLEAMLGSERAEIEAAIRKDPAAHLFVCEYGMTAIAALIETSQGKTFNVPAARKEATDPTNKEHYSRKSLSGWRIADRRKEQLRSSADDLGGWAERQHKGNKDIPTASAALNMPAAQVADITAMIHSVEQLSRSFGNLSPMIEKGQQQLDDIFNSFKALGDARITEDYGTEVIDGLEKTDALIDAVGRTIFSISAGRTDLDTLLTAVSGIKQDSKTIQDNARQERRALVNGGSPDFSSVKSSINQVRRGSLKDLREAYKQATQSLPDIFKHAEPLLFVLRYFRALNDPKATPPSEADMKKFKDSIAIIETSPFFGGGPVNVGADLMKSVIGFISRQVNMRLQMQSGTGALPGMIPTLSEAQAYFATLDKPGISNAVVRKAYTDFATAWFQHRVITTPADMAVDAVDDVFKMPPSIAGARSIVCSGYAQMGAALMLKAGANRSITFTTAVRASDEQIKANQISDGHAIAKITRQGKSFFITNYLTADTETEAMNVAWQFPNLPLHKATGPTNKASLDALVAKLAKKM